MRAPTDRELYGLFERSPIGMYRATEDGRFVYANPALARLLGYGSVDELLAVNLATDVYEDPGERARLIREHRGEDALDGVRVHWRTHDGRRRIVQLYGHIALDERGEASFDVSVVDITDAEAASEQLRDQREELERAARTLELVLRQMPAMYWVVDRDLRILANGGAIQEVLGLSPERWIGRTMFDLIAEHRDSGDTLPAHARALAGETMTYSAEFRGKQLTTTIGPFRRDGEIVGVIGTSIDVTASHALERRMVDAQRAESLGVLAGGLAHDFNNLLVAILGNADLGLRDTPPGVPGRAALENIRHASLRAAELTDQLLAYAGRGSFGATRVDPAAVVDELLRISAPTMPPEIDVRVELPRGLGLRGDAAQVRQVLLNLIANARDALAGAAAGGGTISISGTAIHHHGLPDPDDIVTAAAGSYVQLEIADDGPGIDLEARRRLFEPFFTTKPTGHGLGLPAVLGIVRAHRGGLRLISAPGAGARFQVLWPAATTPAEQPAVAPPHRTVLVVDDEDLVRSVVARMIEDLGYAALTAADGPTGIELLDRHEIDAVLVDMTMPRMNGADVIAAMRAKQPGLRIVLCTGFDRERRGPVKADAYLPKPFRIEALEEMLAKLLG